MRRITSWLWLSAVFFAAAAGSEPTTRPAEKLSELQVGPGDTIEMEFDGRQDAVTVRESRPVLRYLRQIEGRWTAAEGRLLYGVPYVVEAHFGEPHSASSLWVRLEWGSRDIDRHDMLLERHESTEGRQAIYRSAEQVVFEDPQR